MTALDGSFRIGDRKVQREETFRAQPAAGGELLDPPFSVSSADDVAEACRLADSAFDAFRELSPERRAGFLETVAANIQGLGDVVIERAMAESGLARARLQGELGRTAGQFRLFASVVRDGRWQGVVIDSALPEREPLPRPDLRQRRIPLGPVAVFGASNFPLAFSVGGGDTASALAAGCPVVVRGHPAHPGTSSLVAEAICAAIAQCGLPAGTFSLIQGPSHDLGAALVGHPSIKAVGFTGSRTGGLALAAVAARRAEPIPVYAEMSSVNPVVLFSGALAAHSGELAKGFVTSFTLGSGQFCTNPGIVLGVAGPDFDRFISQAASMVEAAEAQVMLTEGIHKAFENAVSALAAKGAKPLVQGAKPTGCNAGQASLFVMDGKDFRTDEAFSQEVFGASSVIVRAENLEEIAMILDDMEGQLTATLHFERGDHDEVARLLPIAERKAGRILVNGWPTGVEVSYAMVHGGPFPATSDSRTTSVGASAIERFLRPVCYQNFPDELLPPALQHSNPQALPRLVDGKYRIAADPDRGMRD